MKAKSSKDSFKSGTLSNYFKDVSKFPQLTHEQSVALFQQFNAGDQRAKNKLVESNLRLVISIANNFRNAGLPFEDIVQEGNIGLIKSIEKYDWTKGFRFSTYATWWVRQAIGQHILKRKKTVRLPVHVVGVQKKMMSAIEEYRKEFNCEPTTEEISALIGASESVVRATIHGAKTTVSLSDPMYSGNEDSDTVGDHIPDESFASNPFNVLSQKEIVEITRRSMHKLTNKEKAVLRLRYGISENPTDHENFPVTQEELVSIVQGKGLDDK